MTYLNVLLVITNTTMQICKNHLGRFLGKINLTQYNSKKDHFFKNAIQTNNFLEIENNKIKKK